jgi:hypothetical protein
MVRKAQVPDGEGRKVFSKSTFAEVFYGDECNEALAAVSGDATSGDDTIECLALAYPGATSVKTSRQKIRAELSAVGEFAAGGVWE